MVERPKEPPKVSPEARDLVVLWFGGLTICYLFVALTRSPLMIPIGLPVWLPLAFGCYAVARRQFSLQALFVLITSEAIAIAIARWSINP